MCGKKYATLVSSTIIKAILLVDIQRVYVKLNYRDEILTIRNLKCIIHMSCGRYPEDFTTLTQTLSNDDVHLEIGPTGDSIFVIITLPLRIVHSIRWQMRQSRVLTTFISAIVVLRSNGTRG